MKSVLGLLLGVFAIGFAGIWVRISPVGPIGTAFWRLTLATFVVFLWGLINDQKSLLKIFERENAKSLKLMVFAGLALGVDLAIWHLSLHKTSVALATLFTNFAPIFMLVGSLFFLGEKIEKKALVGIGFCLAGILCLALKKTGSEGATTASWTGNFIALFSAVFYAGYLLLIRKAKIMAIKPLYVIGILSFSGAFVLFMMTLAFEPASFQPHGLRAWAILLSLAITAQILGQGLISNTLSRVSNDLASAILCLQAVFAALAGYALLGERLTVFQILGGLLILFGIFIIRVKRLFKIKRAINS